ncbi:MAG: DUF421 domain-containing protein [Ruminococcaceae bacterium]|nr:DUF421 domain-containing protein [Oscillospiraceae bacterium]
MVISVIRTALMYIFVIFAIRIMGKRQLSDMQTSELVVTMIIADIASIPMQNTSQPLLSGIVPVLILISGEIFLSVLMMKIPVIRNLLCGRPEIIIENGVLKQNMLRRLRLTTEDLSVLLRQQGIFAIEDVQFCIIETNGQISVLLKPEKRNPSMEDMGLPAKDTGIEAVIISDGEMLSRSMALCNVDELWIKKTLAKENTSIEQVMLMTANRLKEYNIIRKCDE